MPHFSAACFTVMYINLHLTSNNSIPYYRNNINAYGCLLYTSFRNQPLGCTATIVYQMYREQKAPLDRATACLLYTSGIGHAEDAEEPKETKETKAAKAFKSVSYTHLKR